MRARFATAVPLDALFGMLAGRSSTRAELVPKTPAAPSEPPKQLPRLDEEDQPTTSAKSAAKKTAEPSRHLRSWLLQRVFAVDTLKCEKCGGRLRHVLGELSGCAVCDQGDVRPVREDPPKVRVPASPRTARQSRSNAEIVRRAALA